MRDIDYALEWYKYGLDKNDDAIVKFMMHWIAFNWLYSAYGDRRETNNIKAFCQNNYDSLSHYDAFSDKAIEIFMTSPVYDVIHDRNENRKQRYEKLKNAQGVERLESLFLTIYQVRCNLFHGSKSLHIDRDIQLVRAASIILENYLKALLVNP